MKKTFTKEYITTNKGCYDLRQVEQMTKTVESLKKIELLTKEKE